MERATAGQGSGLRRLRVAFAALASVWIVYATLTVTEAAPGTELLGAALVDVIYAGLLLGAGLLCLARVRGNQGERRVWAAFGTGPRRSPMASGSPRTCRWRTASCG